MNDSWSVAIEMRRVVFPTGEMVSEMWLLGT